LSLPHDDLAVGEPAGHAALRLVERDPHGATLARAADTTARRLAAGFDTG
jgi:hypothetical protein